MRLEDRVAVATGAAQGIGLACAQAFSREGAQVLITDLNEDAGRREVLRLRSYGARASFAACDVSRKDHVDAAIAAAVNEFGRVDILVANAGIVHVAVSLSSDEASYLTGQTIYPDGGRLALNYTVPVPD